MITEENNVEKILKEHDQRVALALGRTGLMFEGLVKQKTPLVTGRLQGSIASDLLARKEKGKWTIDISTKVEYAPNVEFSIGMRNIPSRRAMFRRTIEQDMPKLQKFLSNQMKII